MLLIVRHCSPSLKLCEKFKGPLRGRAPAARLNLLAKSRAGAGLGTCPKPVHPVLFPRRLLSGRTGKVQVITLTHFWPTEQSFFILRLRMLLQLVFKQERTLTVLLPACRPPSLLRDGLFCSNTS